MSNELPPLPEARETRTAFVALIGAPNAGKSTLTNSLTGAKVSIVSPKVQTTRFRVSGVLTEGDTQLVLVDTPGIFQPKQRLDRAMVSAAWGGAGDADVICLLVDCTKKPSANLKAILEQLKERPQPVFLILNKVDILGDKPKLLALATELNQLFPFKETFMISALGVDGLHALKASLFRMAKPSPWFFAEDQLSDIHERLLAAEITREKLFLQLEQELPYSLTVETERWEDQPRRGRKPGGVKIYQTIFIERDGQKKIVLGKQGDMLKTVGQLAREELSQMLDRPVHLFLHVKVREDWKNRREHYQAMGLDF